MNLRLDQIEFHVENWQFINWQNNSDSNQTKVIDLNNTRLNLLNFKESLVQKINQWFKYQNSIIKHNKIDTKKAEIIDSIIKLALLEIEKITLEIELFRYRADSILLDPLETEKYFGSRLFNHLNDCQNRLNRYFELVQYHLNYYAVNDSTNLGILE